jgi:hypothetical protein
MPSSVPTTAAPLRLTPDTVTMKVAAVRAAVPVNTNFPSVKADTLYPAVISAPVALKLGAAVQPTAGVCPKNEAGHMMVIEFWVAAHPAVACGRLVAVVNVKTGATAMPILRLANGIIMDTEVTVGVAAPIIPESVHVAV